MFQIPNKLTSEVARGKSASACFSLIELLVVVAVLGALIALVLPVLNSTEIDAQNTVADSEMAGIVKAFERMYSDCQLDDDDLDDIAQDGLWVLYTNEQPTGCYLTPPDDFDFDKGYGWQGPYVQTEGIRELDISSADGQDTAGTTDVPVILDPFHEADTDDGHYYRVMIPTGAAYKKNIALVFVGKNGTLESTAGAEEVTADSDGDDKVMLLLPMH